MMAERIVLVLIMMLILIPKAEAVTIDWASIVSDSNAVNAEEALGKPDNVLAFFGINLGVTRTATYSGFGAGETINYDTVDFATLLGVSEAMLATADFFTTEYSGAIGPYEAGLWEFRDASNYVSFYHSDVSPIVSGPLAAFGNISNQAYANFFGMSTYPQAGGWGYLLFDIDGNSNVNPLSGEFRVTLTATYTGGGTDPEPDVMGRIQSAPNPIPEPSSLLLLGIVLLPVLKRKKR